VYFSLPEIPWQVLFKICSPFLLPVSSVGGDRDCDGPCCCSSVAPLPPSLESTKGSRPVLRRRWCQKSHVSQICLVRQMFLPVVVITGALVLLLSYLSYLLSFELSIYPGLFQRLIVLELPPVQSRQTGGEGGCLHRYARDGAGVALGTH